MITRERMGRKEERKGWMEEVQRRGRKKLQMWAEERGKEVKNVQ